MLSPVLDRLAQEDSYEVFKVNIDEDKAFAKELGVSSIPSVFVYKNGQVVANW
ncbi:thioredoxin, partial [Mycoplasmopsis synoviae]